MYLRISTSLTKVAGMGPEAWNRDHRTLKMYTPHHPVHTSPRSCGQSESAARPPLAVLAGEGSRI